MAAIVDNHLIADIAVVSILVMGIAVMDSSRTAEVVADAAFHCRKGFCCAP
jgi:hypothetical protein